MKEGASNMVTEHCVGQRCDRMSGGGGSACESLKRAPVSCPIAFPLSFPNDRIMLSSQSEERRRSRSTFSHLIFLVCPRPTVLYSIPIACRPKRVASFTRSHPAWSTKKVPIVRPSLYPTCIGSDPDLREHKFLDPSAALVLQPQEHSI
ncbi:unnamed protein product [Ectocarpus sp. 12 AP-2014]